jgi:hypothetical protein
LRAAGFVVGGGPEARRVGRKRFVNPDQFIVQKAKLKLCVSEQDSARFGVGGGLTINIESYAANSSGDGIANERGGLVKRNVFVVAAYGFGGWREYGLG